MKQVLIEANSIFIILPEYLLSPQDILLKNTEKWKEGRKFHVGEFPLFIDVEVTSACNLKCPLRYDIQREDDKKVLLI